ncbi:MAG: class I SAM-dependent methyltransferase [Rhodoferax sp.]|nr:class I SAM-dependent methyltransferase [Rhodoferax sp.]
MSRFVIWPVPAVLSWVAAWAVLRLAQGLGLSTAVAAGMATGLGVCLSLWASNWWRRVLIALGFPVSFLLGSPSMGLGHLPAVAWLAPLLLLLVLYPMKAWRDAPLFPTPQGALLKLQQLAPLPAGAMVLDAGCGLGDGLKALRAAYPEAQLQGVEWSWALCGLCARRCPWANVRQGDIWDLDWSHYELVYLFQRPESMPRAVNKARARMRPGSWLVSLEFEATALRATASYELAGGKMVWLYRVPFTLKSGEPT